MPEKGRTLEDEFAFIRDVSGMFQSYQSHTLVPTGDDAAVYLPGRDDGQIVCVDTMIEGVHFKKETLDPFHIGYKALAVNVSDIAAMGGTPTYFLVALGVSKQWSHAQMSELYQGLKDVADMWRMDLLGGDTVSSPESLIISVTAIGKTDPSVRLLRSNARPGDIVFVTGHLGDSAAGLHVLLHHPHLAQSASYQSLVQAHRMPQPHVEQGGILSRWSSRYTFAVNDVSDGIASEASELAVDSKVDMVIEKEKVPLSKELSRYAQEISKDPYEWAFYGGEDFVLMGTVPASCQEEVARDFQAQNLPFYPIGYVQTGEGRVWLQENGTKVRLPAAGYNHFRSLMRPKDK